jgi:hypothetical protein
VVAVAVAVVVVMSHLWTVLHRPRLLRWALCRAVREKI